MSNYNIPKAIKPIIDEFISGNFRPYTYKILANRLRIDSNTLVQRINRNEKYFTIEGVRPKVIKLNKKLEDIYFYRDKNTCQICQKQKDPSELLIRFKDPYLKEKNKLNNLHDWDNVITCCQDCKEMNLIKKLSYKQKIEHIGSSNHVWEYKEIEIREEHKIKNPYMKLYDPDYKESEMQYEHYHEFNEFNGQGWFHIIDDNNERCEHLLDILNYFGNQGWELILVKQYPPAEPYEGWGNERYLFKRKKIIEGSLSDSTK